MNRKGHKRLDVKVRTGGNGLWSRVAKEVIITKIEWEMSDILDETYVKLYLDPETWNQKEDGLIYTDDTFEANMRNILCNMKCERKLIDLPWEKLSYTEQGMQGGHKFCCPDDCNSCPIYVSMILGSW